MYPSLTPLFMPFAPAHTLQTGINMAAKHQIPKYLFTQILFLLNEIKLLNNDFSLICSNDINISRMTEKAS